MTIKEYTEKNNLPEMKLLGEMKYFRYYIEKNLSDEETGIPMVITEHKTDNSFEINNADTALNIMGWFL